MDNEEPRKIFDVARRNMFLIEHTSPLTMCRALKSLAPFAEATNVALEKLSESVAFALPDDQFFSKDGDAGEGARKEWAKNWRRSVEPEDVDAVESYEAQLYVHALCIEVIRRGKDLDRSSQLSCKVGRDHRFLDFESNAFRPCYSQTSGGVCATTMFYF